MKCKTVILIIFAYASNAYAACPSGYYGIEANSATVLSMECLDGYVDMGEIDTCTGVRDKCWGEYKCDAGVSRIRTSSGVDTPLYGIKVSSPALHVQVGDKICYGNLASGTASPAINMNVDGKLYHLATIHECISWGVSCSASGNGEYTTNFSGRCQSATVRGISICGSGTGTQYATTTRNLAISSETADNTNCWCRIFAPATSPWIFVKNISSANECSRTCAAECANALSASATFRATAGNNFIK